MTDAEDRVHGVREAEKPDEEGSTEHERGYVRGSRMANVLMLGHVLRHLGYDDPEADKTKWISEREAVIRELRTLCEEFGDNEWPESLHLGDVIEKHLSRHLLAPDEEPTGDVSRIDELEQALEDVADYLDTAFARYSEVIQYNEAASKAAEYRALVAKGKPR